MTVRSLTPTICQNTPMLPDWIRKLIEEVRARRAEEQTLAQREKAEAALVLWQALTDLVRQDIGERLLPFGDFCADLPAHHWPAGVYTVRFRLPELCPMIRNYFFAAGLWQRGKWSVEIAPDTWQDVCSLEDALLEASDHAAEYHRLLREQPEAIEVPF